MTEAVICIATIVLLLQFCITAGRIAEALNSTKIISRNLAIYSPEKKTMKEVLMESLDNVTFHPDLEHSGLSKPQEPFVFNNILGSFISSLWGKISGEGEGHASVEIHSPLYSNIFKPIRVQSTSYCITGTNSVRNIMNNIVEKKNEMLSGIIGSVSNTDGNVTDGEMDFYKKNDGYHIR